MHRNPALPMLLAFGVAQGVGCAQNGPPPSADGAVDTVRLLAYNIHHAEGMDGRVDLDRIARLVLDLRPDLVALQEVDSVTERTGRVDQAAELGRLTGMEPVFGAFMPYQGGAYGMALLSRWPIRESRNLRLPDGAEPRTALSALVVSPRSGRALRLVGVHLYRTEEERLAQARVLAEHLQEDATPTILAGDFNSTPESPVMTWLAESWTVVEKGEDRLTFPSSAPEREIDFVLVRPPAAFDVLRDSLLDEPVASDHRPVLVELLLHPIGPPRRTPPSRLPARRSPVAGPDPGDERTGASSSAGRVARPTPAPHAEGPPPVRGG